MPDSFHFLSSIIRAKTILPVYHAVAEKPLPHVKHLYRMKTVEEFLIDLEFLLKYYEPVDVEKLRDIPVYKQKPAKPVFHLTFDDGLKEMSEIVAPILLKKGIPATFFINSGFVDNKALFYRYHASLAVEQLLNEGKLTDTLKTEILSCSYEKKQKLFEFYSQQQVNAFLEKKQPYLTTNQIVALREQGFAIGAHSIDHPYFHKIALEEQIRQTKESLQTIYSIINQDLRLFAFPFTDFDVSKEFFQSVSPYVDLTFGTANLKNDEIRFNLQRIPAEADSYIPLKKIMRNQYFRYMAKRLLWRNNMKR